MPCPNPQPILVCGLTGGGVDGAYTAGLAQAIGNAYPAFPKRVDIWAGTSIGAMAATMFATGHSTQDVVDLFANFGGRCFTRSLLRLLGRGGRYAKWDGVGLHDVLVGAFGSATLGDVPTRLVLPTVLVSGPSATVVAQHNFPDSPFLGRTLVDACMASAAAPGFFPMRAFPNPGSAGGMDAYADGGLGCNFPGLLAIDIHRLISGLTDDDFVLLGLGTGTTSLHASADALDRGFIPWLSDLAGAFIGASESTEYAQAQDRLGARFLAVRGPPTGSDSVDDASVIPQRIADGLATDVTAAVKLLNWLGS